MVNDTWLEEAAPAIEADIMRAAAAGEAREVRTTLLVLS